MVKGIVAPCRRNVELFVVLLFQCNTGYYNGQKQCALYPHTWRKVLYGKVGKFVVFYIDIALQTAYNSSAITAKGVDYMANTTNFSVRMDSEIKRQCEALYGELGMNLTTAINVFLRQSLRAGGFPFEVRMEQPNKETMAAMLEAERIARDPSVKRYSDVEEALRALKE